ncbi:hypothetical protein OG474_32445 [Kribbella sp. NBC_01505]|uniref:hypothetical protein n=1 Tax=Kribbella sp. NBC_01505 TaxID=2903580 RepID=UPI003865518B
MVARAERKAFYGIAEIADALGLNRQLVTAWRRRRSHGIPDPDGELSSGPIWRGTTIEPWIEVVRSQRDSPAQPISPEFALKAGRRMLRVAALLLEEPIRLKLLSQSLAEARELLPIAEDAADDPLGRAVRAVLSPLRAPDPGNLHRFRRKVLAELTQLETVVDLAAESLPEADSAG